MNFSGHALSIVQNYCADPTNTSAQSGLGSLYWEQLSVQVSDAIRKKEDVTGLLTRESDFFDFGIVPAILPKHAEVRTQLTAGHSKEYSLKMQTVSGWLLETLRAITQGNKKEFLEKEIAHAQRQSATLRESITALQQARRQKLSEAMVSTPPKEVTRQATLMDQLEELVQQSIKTKRLIARGTFLPATAKREHVLREQTVAADRNRIESLLGGVSDKEIGALIKALNKQIDETLIKSVDIEEAIAKKQEEILVIDKKQSTISLLEVENHVVESIEYIRDLVRLSAKRLRLSSCSILRPEDVFFTPDKLRECLDRILEFDPRIFHNDRVAIFGKPGVMMVPGNGSAMYDWKNNLIVVPIIAPAGNLLGSIATGMIEYRLDVDEDKKLLTSYNQIPECADIKSIFQLKTRLIKEYITWMTSEYKGYRILSQDVKKWFDYEIGPAKNDIMTPFEFTPFEMPPAEFKRRAEECETRLATGLEEAKPSDLWSGGIFAFQNGKFERAVELFSALVKKVPNNTFGHYNLGHAAAKSMHKQEAMAAFLEFCKQMPQSWWSSVARDHVRHLQMG